MDILEVLIKKHGLKKVKINIYLQHFQYIKKTSVLREMGVFLEYVNLRSINMHYRSLQINSQKIDCLHGQKQVHSLCKSND